MISNNESQLQSIESNAFTGCQYLTAVDLPNNLRMIGASAFSCCKKLSYVNINKESKLETIKENAFSGTNLKTFFISSCVTQFEPFSGSHRYLTKINLAIESLMFLTYF